MPDPLSTLTDKEREALRLLLAGHDAKSSAVELGLSVHTVNDRLRNARRKLGVSSSREAARILGEAEEPTEEPGPQNDAHTSFGIPVPAQPTDTADLNNTEPTGPFGFTWLAGGMLIMSILIGAAILAVVYSSDDSANLARNTAPTEASDTVESSTERPPSLDRAERFLKLVDADDWAGSWEAAGSFFQAETTADEWASVVEPLRQPLGTVAERRLVTVQRADSLPGAPEGEYEVLQFQTKFEGREKLVLETVVMLSGQNGWEVTGYFML